MPDDTFGKASDAARFAAIVACSSDAIISKSLDGIVETWNPAAERLFGWTAQEMIGQSINRIIPDDKRDEEEAILEQIRRGEVVPRFRTRRLTKNGEMVPIAVTVSPVTDPAGRIIGASKIANDLRNERRLVGDLRRKSEQFTALANNIPQLAWIADKNGWIFWYNQRWYDYTGTTLKDMEGWGWRSVHHPDHVERVTNRIQHSWETGEPWEDTFPLRRADGVYRWFLSRANPLRDEQGEILLWCGTNTDITEELEAKSRIAMLVREVNHRSRNMLATIKAMIAQSGASSREVLAENLDRRITALAVNQELLDGGDWSGARLVDVIEGQVRHVGKERRHRMALSGPDDVLIRAQHAEALGLAINELATNAARHGALSNETGTVHVAWKLATGADGEERLEIEWREIDGPPVTPPTHRGFGTVLIERNVAAAFGGEVVYRHEPGGVEWQLSCRAGNCLVERIERLEMLLQL